MSRAAEMLVRAPAKLNLVLAVGAPGADGFHPLVSVMEAVDLCDTLRVRVSESSRSSVTVHAPMLAGGDTLVTRAVSLLLDAAHITADVEIELDKQIPAGAGLGGGSSNAAAALGAVNQLLGAPCSDAQLVRIASQVGSDVPFFLDPQHGALVQGRGEHVTALAAGAIPNRNWLIAWPGTACATGEVYGRYRTMRGVLPDPADAVLAASEGRFINDLAAPALELNAQMGVLYDRCTSVFATDAVLVAGSGSSVAVALSEEIEGISTGRCSVSVLRRHGLDKLVHDLDGAVIAYCSSWRSAPDWL